jgi:protein-S-isoprenylcysteine O-methyltransferase Ste14
MRLKTDSRAYVRYVTGIITGIAIILSDVTALLSPIICFLVVYSAVIPHEEKNLAKNIRRDYERSKKEVRRI